MNKELQTQAKQFNNSHRRRRRWYKILSVPICLMVFITTYALILPAITLETTPDTFCGYEQHRHDDACYQTPGVPEHTQYVCEAALTAHSHTDACYDGSGTLVCGKEEVVYLHTHNAFCFDSGGEVICTLPETVIPAAAAVEPQEDVAETDDNLSVDETAAPEEAPEDESAPIADAPAAELPAHQHTAECLETVPAVEPQGLICQLPEHVHTDECFVQPVGDEPAEDEDALTVDAIDTFASADDLSGLTVTVRDDITHSGTFVAELVDADGNAVTPPDGVTYTWYKSVNGGPEAPVTSRSFRIAGETILNPGGDYEEAIHPALDGGGVTMTQTSVTYRAVLCLNGVEQDGMSAGIVNDQYQTAVLNGSFETPVCGSTYQPFISSGQQNIVWKTTASDDKIELVSVDSSKKDGNSTHYALAEKWHGLTSAPDGTQVAEINAEAYGALYQDVLTTPGLTMSWRVEHMARTRSGDNRYNGTDSMYVLIMETSAAHALAETRDHDKIVSVAQAIAAGTPPAGYEGAASFLCQSTSKWTSSGSGRNQVWSNTASWQEHSGTYTVPAGQYQTTYFFVAVSTASKDATIGNHIDNVWFSTEAPPPSQGRTRLTLSKVVSGSLTSAQLDELLYHLQFNIIVTADNSVLRTINAYELGSWVQLESGSYELNRTLDISSYGWTDKTIDVVEAEGSADITGLGLTAEKVGSAVTVRSGGSYNFSFVNTYTENRCTLTLKKIVNAPNLTGSYDITVTCTAPDGSSWTETYSLRHNAQKIIRDIAPNSTITISEPEHEGYHVSIRSGDTLLADSDSYTFTISGDTDIAVHNTASVALPATGGLPPQLFVFGGLAMVIVAVIGGYIVRRRYRKDER